MPLKPGNKAPHFSLADQEALLRNLSLVFSPYTVLYFYPKDDTPTCTLQSKEFSKSISEFHRRGAQVFGISSGSVRDKQLFAKKHNLEHPLLADTTLEVSKAYKVHKLGIERTTFILNKDKEIIKVFDNIDVKTHIKEVLDYLDSLDN